MRVSLGSGLTLTVLMLAAGCAPVAGPGAPGTAVQTAPAQTAPGQAAPGATPPGTTAARTVPFQIRIPRLQMPVFGAPAATATAAGQPRVTDPFAGQGVRTPAIEGAPATGTAAGAQPAPAAPQSHTVVSGDSAWSIARKYGISLQQLAAANNLPESMTVRLGQTLTIPAAGPTRVAVTAPGAGSPTPAPPSANTPLPRETTTPAARPQAPDLGATRTAASGSGRLLMPVDGAIIRAYSKGQNEGIDVAAAAGTPVRAAAGGTVAAITRDTEGVPIVVIRHQGDLLTVYAGLDGLRVDKGQQVSAGQTIGTARGTGSIHFEVRKGFDSVDPEGYL
ncbi:M23 family metallopeptidase [uncultured Paracoccus sp.]|uniref:M23 family metallopeptidase n=1 Tax=uncultured Paracoccus sp. TaxID=189685 RepID=UPI00261097A7|nr:M23 family metallopeptidase [uncultured Paracoccus sp.]